MTPEQTWVRDRVAAARQHPAYLLVRMLTGTKRLRDDLDHFVEVAEAGDWVDPVPFQRLAEDLTDAQATVGAYLELCAQMGGQDQP